jgi:hypothetical protein
MSFQGLVSSRNHSKIDKKISLFLMLLSHIQLLIGVCLYFISPIYSVPFKDAMADSSARFDKVEHPVMMLVVILILTIIHVKTKKSIEFNTHKKKLIFYSLVIIILFFGVPWGDFIM